MQYFAAFVYNPTRTAVLPQLPKRPAHSHFRVNSSKMGIDPFKTRSFAPAVAISPRQACYLDYLSNGHGHMVWRLSEYPPSRFPCRKRSTNAPPRGSHECPPENTVRGTAQLLGQAISDGFQWGPNRQCHRIFTLAFLRKIARLSDLLSRRNRQNKRDSRNKRKRSRLPESTETYTRQNLQNATEAPNPQPARPQHSPLTKPQRGTPGLSERESYDKKNVWQGRRPIRRETACAAKQFVSFA